MNHELGRNTSSQEHGADLWWARDDAASAAWGFTSRRAGRSSGVYQGLNIGSHVGDDEQAVRRNREMVAHSMGMSPQNVIYATQVHGCDVVEVSRATSEPPTADALVTTDHVALAVMVADCVPVLAWSGDGTVRGVAHAGRPGMHAGVTAAMLNAMADLGAQDVNVRLGPSICPRCYEVPDAMRDELAARRPVTASMTGWGTPAVDVAAGVLADIAHYHTKNLVRQCQTVPGCTFESTDLYSHRRDGTTGRFAGYLWPASSD